jgi:hypothetical protein
MAGDELPVLIGFKEIFEVLKGITSLYIAGADHAEYLASIGLDAEGLYKAAEEAAAEEFSLLPALPTQLAAEGRLRALHLSANQRKVTKEALEDTFVVAFEAGVTAEKVRSLIKQMKEDPPDG